ncbi:MAG: ABC transporter ATP-binding protein [Magnetococcales bacterium]|nr:ABC transporter ATP-binding protein [Magnetococcales bacterium]MBF0323323.1 ABC transporter ATP-binding protein [Magnetococcales bacterium]
MSETPLLEARDVLKTFRTPAQSLDILKRVCLRLEVGEMAALQGVSGAGKSTLIQILGCLDRPTSGQVLLNGQDIFALRPVQQAGMRNRHIGFVYQSHRLLPEFSAVENVMMPLLIGRHPREMARTRAEEILTEVGLADRMHHKPGQLSGGEQQRVAIARAVVHGPDLLLADEPTGNLDLQTAETVFQMFMELNRRRRLTCLMVTHNPELAARLDRRFHLRDGHLLEVTAEGKS